MEKEDELMFFAGMALIGLVIQDRPPNLAAKMAWEYAQALLKEKKCSQE